MLCFSKALRQDLKTKIRIEPEEQVALEAESCC